MRMPFGKYQDVELEKVPKPYLRWLRNQSWVGGWLIHAIDQVCCDGTAPVNPSENCQPATREKPQVEPYSLHSCQQIRDKDQKVIAWMTDPQLANEICRFLNDNHEKFQKPVLSSTDPGFEFM